MHLVAYRKVYIIEIEECDHSTLHLWYKNQVGKRFHASLGIHERAGGEMVPAFILNEPPFFPVLPQHCRVVEERTYGSEEPDS